MNKRNPACKTRFFVSVVINYHLFRNVVSYLKSHGCVWIRPYTLNRPHHLTYVNLKLHNRYYRSHRCHGLLSAENQSFEFDSFATPISYTKNKRIISKCNLYFRRSYKKTFSLKLCDNIFKIFNGKSYARKVKSLSNLTVRPLYTCIS